MQAVLKDGYLLAAGQLAGGRQGFTTPFGSLIGVSQAH
jgi:hypothetical protein